MEQIMYRMM